MSALSAYFVVPPNWSDLVKVSHIWRTSIQTSITGREKRAALFTRKRKRIAYSSIAIYRDELVWLEAMFFKYLHYQWGFPIWPDKAILSAAGNIGDGILTVESTIYRRFEVGDECILVDKTDFRTYEVQTISGITLTQISLGANLTKTWGIKSFVYPIIASRISEDQVLSYQTDEVVEFSVDAMGTIEAVISSSSSGSSSSSSSSESSSSSSESSSSSSSSASSVLYSSSSSSASSGVLLSSSSSSSSSTSLPTAYVWSEITGGDLWQAGESAFFMLEFNGILFCATESSGKVFGFNGTYWVIVFDTNDLGFGNHCNSYHLGVYEGYLYVGFRDFLGDPTSIRVFRSSTGNRYSWSCVHYEENYKQCRFLPFNAYFYTFIGSYSSPTHTKIYRKTSGAPADIGSYVTGCSASLYGDPVVFNGNLYIGGAGVYKMDTSHNITQVWPDGIRTVTSLCVHDGYLYAIDIVVFNAGSGNGYLVRSADGIWWSGVATLPEPEGWTLESYNGELYLGTRYTYGNGKVYRFNTTTFALTIVGTTITSGFFSLRAYGTKLYAGTYDQSQVRSYTLAPV